MNKYLVKVAQKVELEPGVHYNLAKHEINVTPARIAEHQKRVDSRNRGAYGLIYGTVGGLAGAAAGHGTASKMVDRSKGSIEAKLVTPTPEDYAKFYAGAPTPPKYQVHAGEDPLRALDRFSERAKEHKAVYEEYSRANKPSTKMVKLNVPGESNLYSKLNNRISPASFKRIGGVLGLGLGGLALGGVGHSLGGIAEYKKPVIKNEYISKLEKKYQPHIDKLEGW